MRAMCAFGSKVFGARGLSLPLLLFTVMSRVETTVSRHILTSVYIFLNSEPAI